MKRRRRRVTAVLIAAWLVVSLSDLLLPLPPTAPALAWVAVFGVAAGVSAGVLPAALRYRRTVHKLPGTDLRRVLSADSYVRREVGRLLTASSFCIVGFLSLFGTNRFLLSLFFAGAFGILSNTLHDREDRRDQRRLEKELE